MKQLAYAIGLIGFAGATVVHADDQPQKVEKIEVTGSSIKRTAKEGALPVSTITKEEINRSGATTAQDLVNLIPSNFGGTVASQNVGASGVASTAGLRGLPSKYTLVLLNGRRVANYAVGNAVIDLNSIPLSAVERVEVLRDGASAVYGADAIAGVINFILKKDYQGAEVSAFGTKTDQGGGDITSYNVTAGYGDLSSQRFNLFGSVNHEEDDVLKAIDRKFANTAVRPDLGINKASSRNGIPNFKFTDTLGNTLGGINPYRYKGCDYPAFALTQNGSATQCYTDYVKFIDLVPKQKHDNAMGRLVFQINEDNQFFAEAVHVKDNLIAHYSPAPYTKNMIYPANGRFYPTSITLPKGMTLPKGYKFADGTTLAAATVLDHDLVVTPTGPMQGTWRTVAGGGRGDSTDTTTDRAVFGFKGNLFDWDYETAYTHAENKVAVNFASGQFSYAKLQPLLAAGEINVFGDQDAKSLAALNSASLAGQEEQHATSKSDEFDFRASREIAQLPYGPLGFAFGGDYRKEKLDQFSDDVLASGDQVGGAGPIPSVSGGRKVAAVFTEFQVPVYKDLEMSLAGRYDNYKNDFGSSFSKFSPKVGFRWTPTKSLLVRASAAQGFRAPTLYENLLPFTAGNNTNGNYSDPLRCPGGKPNPAATFPVDQDQAECNIQLPAANGGDPKLKPEKSTQWSLGVVFAPTGTFSGSLDYWNIKIDDAIQALSEQSVLNNPAQFADYYYRFDPIKNPELLNGNDIPATINDPRLIKGSTNPNYPLAFVYLPRANTAQFFASGVDLNLQYRFRIADVGSFNVNYDGTYVLTHGYQYALQNKVSDNGVYQDYGPTPRYRHSATLAFSRGAWGASVTDNFTLHYVDYDDGTGSRDVASYNTWDAQVTWKGIKNLDLGLGVKNLLDQDPPSSRTTLNFQTGYDAQFTNPLGRTFYARARYKFW
jgi:iron complex outermembrane receptor protein